jgi:hypothetical protein
MTKRDKMIKAKLAWHAVRMNELIIQGVSKDDASSRAYAEVVEKSYADFVEQGYIDDRVSRPSSARIIKGRLHGCGF